MKRKQLYKISIFLSVIGLTAMYAGSIYINLDTVDIGEIDRSWSGKTVKIQGEAVTASKSSGHLFMDVNDSTGQIMVVNFDSQTSVSKGDRLNVTGHVALYEGTLEVIVDEIEKR